MADNPAGFIGYALTWRYASKRCRQGSQTIMPGAFRRALAGGFDVGCTFDGQVVGSMTAGTLLLSENAHGLLIELQPWTDSERLEQLRQSCDAGVRLGIRFRLRAAALSAPPFSEQRILEATLTQVVIARAPGIHGSWLAPATRDAVWRAQKVNLDAMAAGIDSELEDVEELGCY